MINAAKSLKPFLYSSLFLYFILTSFKGGEVSFPMVFKFKTIVIDAGHGGKDPGAHGAYSFEKNVSLAIAKKLQALLKRDMTDINVVMTRNTDKFIELNKRSQIANDNQANLFVSIHCNSTPEQSGNNEKGVLMLVYGYHRKSEQMEALRENASIYIEKDYQKNYGGYSEKDPAALIVLNTVMQKYRKQSILFGDMLMDQFKEVDHRVCIGVKEQGVFVLARSGMPAVLIETGFINNPEEEDYLNSATGQAEIVDAVVASIKNYKELEDSK